MVLGLLPLEFWLYLNLQNSCCPSLHLSLCKKEYKFPGQLRNLNVLVIFLTLVCLKQYLRLPSTHGISEVYSAIPFFFFLLFIFEVKTFIIPTVLR